MPITKTIPVGSPYDTAHSDVGNITNYDANNWTFDVDTITISEVKNVLGETSSSLAALSTSSNINQWALFRPENSSAPYKLGDFGGYNHQANPTTYVYTQSGSGTYTIYRAPSPPYATSISFAVILKKGERPPASPKDWQYVRLTATVTGDITDTISTFTYVTNVYDNSIIQVPVPSNDPITFNVSFTAQYVNSTNTTVYGAIEDTISSISVTGVPVYNDAPSLASDNTFAPAQVRHYFTVRTGYNPPVISTTYDTASQYDVLMKSYNPYNGLVKNIAEDISEVMYGRTYNYSIIYDSGAYWKVDLKQFYRNINYTYKTDIGEWYKVNSIESGYNFWRTDYQNSTNVTDNGGWD